MNIFQKIGENMAKEFRKMEAIEQYFESGYLRDSSVNSGQPFEKRTSDGPDFVLNEKFVWSEESNIWQISKREWVQTTPFPEKSDKTGFIAGIATRINNRRENQLKKGLAERKDFFAAPKPSEPTYKERRWQSCEDFGYKYSWNQDKNIWNEVGRYKIMVERGMAH